MAVEPKFKVRETLQQRAFFKDLLNQFKAAYPTIPEKRAIAHCAKYAEAVIHELHERFNVNSMPDVGGVTSVRLTEIRKNAGRATVHFRKDRNDPGSKKQVWNWKLFQRLNFPLLNVKVCGNVGYYSKVAVADQYETEILDEVFSIEHELKPETMDKMKRLRESGEVEVYPVVIEPRCIEDYIKASMDTIKTTNKGPAYINKIYYHTIMAKKVLDMSYTCADGRQIYEDMYRYTDTGRQYGIGLSLQRMPMTVRNAITGVSFKYDMVAASYQLLLQMANQLLPSMYPDEADLEFYHVNYYVNNRTYIREFLSKVANIPVPKIKEILTAVGFGAKVADNPFSAVKKMITADQFKALTADEFFCNLVEEMKFMQKMFMKKFDSKYLADNDGYLFGLPYSPITPDGKKRSKNQKMAWIYQRLESEVLFAMIDAVNEHYSFDSTLRDGGMILVKSHDGFMTKYQLSYNALEMMNFHVWKTLGIDLKIEWERCTPIYRGDAPYIREFDEYDKRVVEHRKFIEEEEKLAREIGNLTGCHEQTFPVTEDDPMYEEIRALNPELWRPTLGTDYYSRWDPLLGIQGPPTPPAHDINEINRVKMKYRKIFEPDYDPNKDEFGNDLYWKDDEWYAEMIPDYHKK